jgi:hypothetical protein
MLRGICAACVVKNTCCWLAYFRVMEDQMKVAVLLVLLADPVTLGKQMSLHYM